MSFKKIDIVKNSPKRSIFKFNPINNKFVPVRVDDMQTNEHYYMVEPNKAKIYAGLFIKIKAETYKEQYPTVPTKGNWDFYLFIKKSFYPSITEPGLLWETTSEMISLSTSIDNDGSISFFDSKALSETQVNLFGLAQSPHLSDNLPDFFKDIHNHLEEMELRNHLQWLHGSVRAEYSLQRWEQFRDLFNTYKTTQQPLSKELARDKLVYFVAVAQKNDAAAVFNNLFKNRLLAYKAEREQNKDEFFTLSAKFFGGYHYSKTAKLAAVDSIIDDIDNGVYSFNNLPKAAQNCRLYKILSEYEQFKTAQNIIFSRECILE